MFDKYDRIKEEISMLCVESNGAIVFLGENEQYVRGDINYTHSFILQNQEAAHILMAFYRNMDPIMIPGDLLFPAIITFSLLDKPSRGVNPNTIHFFPAADAVNKRIKEITAELTAAQQLARRGMVEIRPNDDEDDFLLVNINELVHVGDIVSGNKFNDPYFMMAYKNSDAFKVTSSGSAYLRKVRTAIRSGLFPKPKE